MFHLFSLYQLAKTERRPFKSNRNESYLALIQWDHSKDIYGHKVSNVSSKNKISVFLLAFFLLYIIWLPISVSKLLNFSCIIPNQILKNIIYFDINIYTEIVCTFSQAMAQNECTKRERKLGKFDSFRKLSFIWRTLLINLRDFRTIWWTKKKQWWVANKYEASNMEANSYAYCVISSNCKW